MQRKEIPSDVLKRMYVEEEKSAREIAEELEVKPNVVYSRLREYGIARRTRRRDLPVKVLERKYRKEKKTAAEIARELNVSASLVITNLRRANIPVRPTNSKPRTIMSNEDLLRMYQKEGLTIYEIAHKFECNPSTVHRRLIKYGIPRRNSGTTPNTMIAKESLRRMYVDEGKSVATIAREAKCSEGTVWNLLKKYKIKIRGRHLNGVINKEDLQRLYCDEARSVKEIAKIYDCHVGTIHAYRRKFEIPKRRNYSDKHYTRRRKLRQKGEKLFSKMKEMLGGKCSACRRDQVDPAIHHMYYLPEDVISKNYRSSRQYMYHIDLYPLVRADPGRFLLLCSGCHSTIGQLYRFSTGARERMFDMAGTMAEMRRKNPTKHADLVNA